MTIVEIAKKTGVSHTTVSRVLYNKDGVSEATARKIKKVINDLGYTPKPHKLKNDWSEGMGTKCGNIAFICPKEGIKTLATSPIMLEVLHGVEKELGQRNFNLIHLSLWNEQEDIPALVKRHQVDGYIVWSYDIAGVLKDSGGLINPANSVTIMSGDNYKSDFYRVHNDNFKIGRMAAEYLLSRGRKNLLYIDYNTRKRADSRDWLLRHEGFMSVASDDVVVKCTEIDNDPARLKADAAELMDRLIESSSMPDGFFFAADQLTGIIQPVLQSKGLDIPRDADVISCNQEAAYLNGLDPVPASINLQPELLGKRAVELLWDRLEHSDRNEKVIVEIPPILNM
ncbi:MAG: LacI family DNA-binding transcriptional regulator [Sedimentisphaeraceae bacterium JB056]